MYQGNGSIGISKQRVRHPSSYFIVGFFSYCQLILLSIILFCLEISRVEPKTIQYIAVTLTYNSSLVTPKDHSLIASHAVEPHLTGQSSLDLQKLLNLNIAFYFINILASPKANTWHHRGGKITQTIDHFCVNLIISGLCNIHGKQ